MLTDIQARKLFKKKPANFSIERSNTAAMAKAYGVSPKTIRDIWTGRNTIRYWAKYDLDRRKQVLFQADCKRKLVGLRGPTKASTKTRRDTCAVREYNYFS